MPFFVTATLVLLMALPALGGRARAPVCGPQLQGFAAVMDPYGSGFLFRKGLTKRGLGRVAVLSSRQLPSGYTFAPEQWDRVIYYSNPADTAAEILALGEDFRALIDGAESGTVDAALIRDAMRSNGTKTFGATGKLAWARRDKVSAAEALGDLAPPQLASDELSQLKRYAESLGYPIMAKPNRNAGGASGGICRNAADLEQIFRAVEPGSGKLNDMLETDTAVIVQKQLRGREVAFNGFRDDHDNVTLTGDWVYQRRARRGTMGIYVADRLSPRITVGLKALHGRLRTALERTETEGTFHFEMKQGYVIDNANRLSGGGLPLLEAAGTDIDPIDLALDGYFTGSIANYPRHYTIQRYVAAVFISTAGEKRASHRLVEDLEKLKRAGTILDYTFHYPENDPMPRTINSDTTVASLLISAGTPGERETLIDRFLGAQKRGEFER